MEHRITSVRTYFFVYIGLLVLLASTVGAAFLNLGPFNTVVALGIAVVKALLVLLFFMGLRRSPLLSKVFIGFGLIWLAILVGLVLTDYLTRL
ncbi:MAG TPA: cytochrome C oxidase subunit IV family protein [Anaerolineales bacterium]